LHERFANGRDRGIELDLIPIMYPLPRRHSKVADRRYGVDIRSYHALLTETYKGRVLPWPSKRMRAASSSWRVR